MNLNDLINERATKLSEVDNILSLDEPTNEQFAEAEKLQEEVKSFDKKIEVLQTKEEQDARKIAASSAGTPVNGGEEKEMEEIARTFQFTSAIREIKDKKSVEGLAAEMTQEAKRENSSIEGNLAIPEKFVRILRKGEYQKRDLTIGTEGGDVRPLDLRGPIPILAPNPIVAQMGASIYQGLQGNLQFSRHNGAAAMAWEGETDANAETTPTLDNVTLSPNRLGGYTDISQTFIRQSHFDGENFVRNELNRAFAQALDTAAINGSGSGSEPTGLLGLSIGGSDVGTNGGAPTWAVIKGNYNNVEGANADVRNLAALTTPGVKYKLMETPKQASGVEGNFIVNADMNGVPRVLGHPVFTSTLVPSDLTKGSGSSLSAYIVGDWSELMIAQWGGIDLLVDPFTQATSGLVRIIINGYFDVNVRHAASFSASDDLTT